MNWIRKISFERWALANFIILALLGVILRYMLCFPAGGISYLNILHAHSHFALSGWIFMSLVILLARVLKETGSVTFRWILLLSLLSSFGMLASFSVQGYKAVSIGFSTLFLFITYWFSYLVYSRLGRCHDILVVKLMKAGIWFLVISSAGPLTLGALKAIGNTGIIFQNSIYFYLHFQMNGWMLLAILSIVFSRFIKLDSSSQKAISPWINTFILSTLPLFFIFTLWYTPPIWVYLVATVGAILSAISWAVIIQKLGIRLKELPFLIQIALLAISFKVVFQIVVCIPLVGEWAFSSRNLIIGYVHLITLGCVTPVIFSLLIKQSAVAVGRVYVILVLAYLCMLFIQPVLSLFQIVIPHYQYGLLAISILFCLTGIFIYKNLSGR